MSFATLASFLALVFQNAPTLAPLVLQLINAVVNALHGSAAKSSAVKLKAIAPLTAEQVEIGERLAALVPNSGFDGHRIANLIQFALQHPLILTGVLHAFGITIPPEIMALIQALISGGGSPAPAPQPSPPPPATGTGGDAGGTIPLG